MLGIIRTQRDLNRHYLMFQNIVKREKKKEKLRIENKNKIKQKEYL